MLTWMPQCFNTQAFQQATIFILALPVLQLIQLWTEKVAQHHFWFYQKIPVTRVFAESSKTNQTTFKH